MKTNEIPKPPLYRQESPEIKQLKQDAPRHLKSLIEKSIIFVEHNWDEFSPSDFVVLGGGMNAVAYLVRKGKEYVVVKFDFATMKAEAEALSEWWQAGAKVVAVRSSGTSPYSKRPESTQKVKYIILEGVTGASNRPAELAMDYCRRHLDKVEGIGRYMGRQLALMHKVTTKRSFGEFADMTGENKKAYASWNAYLLSFIKSKESLLLSAGFSSQQVKGIKRLIREASFPKTGRYMHGDFSLRNALIESIEPLKIRIIDPNPIVGNVLWDLAIPFNNAAIAQKRAVLLPNDNLVQDEKKLRVDFATGVKSGYLGSTKRTVDENKLLLIQLVQMVALFDIERNRALQSNIPLESDIEFVIRRNLLVEFVFQVLNLGK